ncbi:MAG: M48 family peptidase, partial [Tepidimonas sp.]
MRLSCLLVLIWSLAVPATMAEGLPDLGESSQAGFSSLQERRLGESIMREIRADPSYDDDAEAVDYLNALGNRLVTRGA